MRADRIAPVTWLLAATAAWAVLGLALAFAGMGGRVAAADATGADAQPLPQPVADANATTPAAYDTFAARPPFAQDRRPHPFVLPGGGEHGARGDAAAFDYVLSSVMITPRLRLAIIEPSAGGESVRVREGETAEGLGGWRLLELRPRAAVFEGPGGRRELDLRVWAGGGDGAAPDAMPAPPAPVAVPEPAATPAMAGARPMSAQDAPVADAPTPDSDSAPASAAAPAPTQVQQQMDAIRRRIEARRAQLRREARQDTSQAQPARNP
jgi:general secretion pathway protein N